MRFGEPLAQVVLGEYLGLPRGAARAPRPARRLIAEQASAGPWAALVARLRCLRGIDTLTAVGLVAEIGDFTAFAHPKQLASFLGLVPVRAAPPATAAAKARSPRPAQATPGGC